MILLEKNSSLTIHKQIYNGILQLIANKTLKVDGQLPSVRQLSSDLVINPNTISKAYKELEQNGIIYSKKGIGYFVADNKTTITNHKDYLINEFQKVTKDLLAAGVTKEQLKNIINNMGV